MPQSTLQYHNVQRTIYRSRLINLPKNVVDADGVHKAYLDDDVFAKYGKTAVGRSFFKSAEKIESSNGHGEFSYIIFMSDDICDMIRSAIPVNQRKYLLDATFKICPYGIFKQLLIVYISYLDKVHICLFFFLNVILI